MFQKEKKYFSKNLDSAFCGLCYKSVVILKNILDIHYKYVHTMKVRRSYKLHLDQELNEVALNFL